MMPDTKMLQVSIAWLSKESWYPMAWYRDLLSLWRSAPSQKDLSPYADHTWPIILPQTKIWNGEVPKSLTGLRRAKLRLATSQCFLCRMEGKRMSWWKVESPQGKYWWGRNVRTALLPRSATNQNNVCVRSYNLYNQGALASSTATSTAVKTSLLKLIHVF